MNNYKIIEHLYEKNGIKNYKLRDTQDLLKIHGVDFKEVKGYEDIDDIHRAEYEKFIIDFLNGLGLESRMTLVPKGIYYVEDTDFLIPEDDYFIVVGGIVESIDRNGVKSILRTWNDPEYKDEKHTESEAKRYLRFQYEHNGRAEWLHVTKNGSEWY